MPFRDGVRGADPNPKPGVLGVCNALSNGGGFAAISDLVIFSTGTYATGTDVPEILPSLELAVRFELVATSTIWRLGFFTADRSRVFRFKALRWLKAPVFILFACGFPSRSIFG